MITSFRIMMLLFTFIGFFNANAQKSEKGVLAFDVAGATTAILFLISYLF